MDSRTPLRRTPAGDAEVARPANGLSITQRRILTLLDVPRHLEELPLGAGLDGERLQREAARLAKAGLIAFEMHVDPQHAAAANAGDLRRSAMPFLRPLAATAMLAIVGAIVWTGWKFSARPATAERDRASTVAKPVTTNAAPVTSEPSVIATRVLRGDPRPAPPPPKPATDAATASAPAVIAAPRTEP